MDIGLFIAVGVASQVNFLWFNAYQ